MDIKTLRKNYDKLTANERFSLLVAAGARGDDNEREALLATAPSKTWRVPTTRGLGEAFNFVSLWHIMNQLGYAASLYCLLQIGDDEEILDGALAGLWHFLTNCEAWRAICKEYGVDPEKILEGLPFIEIIDMTELLARRMYDTPLELTELQETIDSLRAIIETKRKEWE